MSAIVKFQVNERPIPRFIVICFDPNVRIVVPFAACRMFCCLTADFDSANGRTDTSAPLSIRKFSWVMGS